MYLAGVKTHSKDQLCSKAWPWATTGISLSYGNAGNRSICPTGVLKRSALPSLLCTPGALAGCSCSSRALPSGSPGCSGISPLLSCTRPVWFLRGGGGGTSSVCPVGNLEQINGGLRLNQRVGFKCPMERIWEDVCLSCCLAFQSQACGTPVWIPLLIYDGFFSIFESC